MTKWIMVVDDDTTNLQMAGHILSKNNMRVTALKSGRALLDYVADKGVPDLILLDIKMPEIDGFETLKLFREFENEKGLHPTPIIFLTADEDTETETRGFEEGVADFIRKPFNPEVLIRRIDNVLAMQTEMLTLKDEATIDKLTGLLNKAAAGVAMSKACTSKTGCLLMIDLDSFKLVNDLYGHEMGDKVLISFAELIRKTVPESSINGRNGGDEFVSFADGVTTEEEVARITVTLNQDLLAKAKELMGEDMNIPLGTSIGAIMVPKYGNDYASLLKLADKALYKVKKNGKHGYALHSSESLEEDETSSNQNIQELSEILGERNVTDVGMQLDMEAFSYVYRYVIRYVTRHNTNACKLLFTLHQLDGESKKDFVDACDEFGNHIRQSLRKSDIMTRNRSNQYYVFFTDFREGFIERVAENIIDKWYAEHGNKTKITYENEFIKVKGGKMFDLHNKHVVIVDDDPMNTQFIAKILEEQGLLVTICNSGKELFEHLDMHEDLPDLILLDIIMPEIDGFEVMTKLKNMESDIGRIPVIFLTADEDEATEVKGLSLGAMDFLRKPVIPQILLLRVNHIMELVMLRKRYHK